MIDSTGPWLRMPSWVLEVELGPRRDGAKILLVRLWTFATWETTADAFVWPGLAELAELVGSRRTLEDQISILTKMGFVTRCTDSEGRLGWQLHWHPTSTPDRGQPPRPTVERSPRPTVVASTPDRGHHVRPWSPPRPTVVTSTPDRGQPPRPTVDLTDQGTEQEQHTDPPDAREQITHKPRGPIDPSLLPTEVIRYLGDHDSTHLLAMTANWCSALAEAIGSLGLDEADIRHVIERHDAITKAAKIDGSLARRLRANELPELRQVWSRFSRTRAWVLDQVESGRAARGAGSSVEDDGPARDEASVLAFEARARGDA